MADRLKARPYLLLALLLVVADQLTKLWVLSVFEPYEVLPVLPVFNLTLVFNPGAAFSFLSDAGGWQRMFFIVLTSLIAIGLVIWLMCLRRGERLTGIALGMILGGALGNLIDRVRLGKVVDFLDFYWREWHWPAFNVADSAITVGVVIMLLASWTQADRR
ncbi:signal peptidase II [Thiolapillus sp.]